MARIRVLSAVALAATLGVAPAGADVAARDEPAAARSSAESAWLGAQDLAIYALGLIGVVYRYGGETPDRGLDCSGLVQLSYAEAGLHVPRTTTALLRDGRPAADPEPGDLLLFSENEPGKPTHVGIYAGDGRFVDAPQTGGRVRLASLDDPWYRERYVGAGRPY